MSRQFKAIPFFIVSVLLLVSCGTVAPDYNYRKLAKASIILGIDIDYDDNHKLYVEASEWIGVPYKYGGNTKAGVDCSGFVRALYKKIYRTTLCRTAEEQLANDCRKIRRSSLKEGDLVFFRNSHRSRKVSHVGIYLKDGFFVHASTGCGVVVSSLFQDYYDRMWITGGRVWNK